MWSFVGERPPKAPAPAPRAPRSQGSRPGHAPLELDSIVTRPAIPSLEDGWSTFETEEARFRRLGVAKDEASGRLRSSALQVLGKQRLAPFRAVQQPGRILWVNFELASELGFDVPRDHRMTPEFERELVEALCLRRVRPDESLRGKPSTLVYADVYGGDGVGTNRGAGRAAFLSDRNLYLKGGLGLTPLAKPNPEDFSHSHGGVSLKEGLREALVGEILHRNTKQGSTRVLALIDPLEEDASWTVYRKGQPDEAREKRAIIVRAGAQLRPGHLLRHWFKGDRYSAGILLRAAAQSGDLVTRPDPVTGAPVADIAATQRRLDEGHALTSAEEVRRKLHHGKLSTSNLTLGGSQIDLATVTTQERSAPLFAGQPDDEPFGKAHDTRFWELETTYDALLRTLEPSQAEKLHAVPLDPLELDQLHDSKVALELLEAAGLPPSIAQALAEQSPLLARSFSTALRALGALEKKGNLDYTAGPVDGSVVDVSAMLRHFPRTHFDGSSPETRLKTFLELLAPRYSGTGKTQGKQRAAVETGAQRLLDLYGQVMHRAEALARAADTGQEEFRSSVIARAALENAPIEELYYADAEKRFIAAVDRYVETGDPRFIQRVIDDGTSRSARSVEGLLRQGVARPLEGGGMVLERRVIRGVEYAVVAPRGGPRHLEVRVPLKAEDGRFRLNVGDHHNPLSEEELSRVLLRCTTDGWSTPAKDLPARVLEDDQGGRTLEFNLPLGTSLSFGSFEGVFSLPDGSWVHEDGENFRNYAFAVPDAEALRQLELELAQVLASA